jgi:hypothetical protein
MQTRRRLYGVLAQTIELMRHEGRAAYELLARVYDGFTEGFDTADLQGRGRYSQNYRTGRR